MLYPMKLTAPLKDYLWGGTRLKDEYGKQTDLEKVAESWELSCHKDGMSVIANGEYAGKTLVQYIEEQGKAVLGTKAVAFPYFPLLIKLIDAKDNLSVQVHPNDDYAFHAEHEYGKTEMWYVVDAEPGASLVYGVNNVISRTEFAERIKNNTLLDICNNVPVKKGDVFFIEAGTLHAIGKGILICEIQQNSNTTYRVYDYGRVGADGKPRELHIEKAQDVTRLAPTVREVRPQFCFNIFGRGNKLDLLAECEYFTVFHLSVQDYFDLTVGTDSFQAVTVLDGDLSLTACGHQTDVRKGETLFLPANLGDYRLTGRGDVIISKV